MLTTENLPEALVLHSTRRELFASLNTRSDKHNRSPFTHYFTLGPAFIDSNPTGHDQKIIILSTASTPSSFETEYR